MGAHDNTITRKRLRSVLSYDPTSGEFFWIKNNKKAGYRHPSGYVKIGIDGRIYSAHRLAWLFVKGSWPKIIDHKNRLRHDNRIENLRDVSSQGNLFNRTYSPKFNRSGLVGAIKSRGRWRAKISVRGKNINLGYFDTAEEAHAAYKAAKSKHHVIR